MENIQIPNELRNTEISDGSELKPAEVAARAQREGSEPPNEVPTENREAQGRDRLRTTDGYTVDQEGLVNNYPVTPPAYVQQQQRFGFTQYAETFNGRAAMLGFVLLLAIELITGQSFISLIS
ncbi:MAG: chlorophyll A-B-binding protein [Leptolyngbyaceae cyanobacterium T60_A2020_046]|nr:chlorophyll A-B-binding protein [Leptolyngbyaceae cyanobacterium T60_A2020_046]